MSSVTFSFTAAHARIEQEMGNNFGVRRRRSRAVTRLALRDVCDVFSLDTAHHGASRVVDATRFEAR